MVKFLASATYTPFAHEKALDSSGAYFARNGGSVAKLPDLVQRLRWDLYKPD